MWRRVEGETGVGGDCWGEAEVWVVEVLVRSAGFIQRAVGSHARFISEGGSKQGWDTQLASCFYLLPLLNFIYLVLAALGLHCVSWASH